MRRRLRLVPASSNDADPPDIVRGRGQRADRPVVRVSERSATSCQMHLKDAVDRMRKAMLAADASDEHLGQALELLERVLGPLVKLPPDELDDVLVELSVCLEPTFMTLAAKGTADVR